jgi:hypothetical protein
VVHKHQVVRIITFCLSKASSDAYRSYRMMMYLALLFYACMDCALRVGSCMVM